MVLGGGRGVVRRSGQGQVRVTAPDATVLVSESLGGPGNGKGAICARDEFSKRPAVKPTAKLSTSPGQRRSFRPLERGRGRARLWILGLCIRHRQPSPPSTGSSARGNRPSLCSSCKRSCGSKRSRISVAMAPS